jgi:hypothetical protein
MIAREGALDDPEIKTADDHLEQARGGLAATAAAHGDREQSRTRVEARHARVPYCSYAAKD